MKFSFGCVGRNTVFFFFIVSSPILLKPVLSQDMPPCPPPGLDAVVNTPEKCMCFYSLISSGLDVGDASTYPNIFTDDTIFQVFQVGKFVGLDNIVEYISFFSGIFITSFVLIGNPVFLEVSSSSIGQCVAVISERRQFSLNPEFMQNNSPQCVDAQTATRMEYSLTMDPTKPISIHKIFGYINDEFISDVLTLFDTPATSENICNNIFKCEDIENKPVLKKLKKNKKRKNLLKKLKKKRINNTITIAPTSRNILKKHNVKKNKKGKNLIGGRMSECMKTFDALPLTTPGELSYVDGNSKLCRIFHSHYASTNPVHCPHVTFEADADIHGYVKCNESKQMSLADGFTQENLGMLMIASEILGLGTSGIVTQKNACTE